jgi:ribosomal protein S27AE
MEMQSADCPKCGAVISDHINQGKIFRCGNCGSSLVWPDHQVKLVLRFGSRLCPSCGVDNEQNHKYCRNCGTALTKVCTLCNEEYYVGDNFCPNGHTLVIQQQKIEKEMERTLGERKRAGEGKEHALEERKREDVGYFLQASKELALEGNLEAAALILEEALSKNTKWAPELAGFPVPKYLETLTSPQASGYGLLVHLAGKSGNKQLAARYLNFMMKLNPELSGYKNALEAARDANIEAEAYDLAHLMGVKWI